MVVHRCCRLLPVSPPCVRARPPPTDRDIAWRYGIDADLTDPDVRCAEVRNWLRYQVLPTL